MLYSRRKIFIGNLVNSVPDNNARLASLIDLKDGSGGGGGLLA
jgi:hypothetical protein